MHITVLVLVIIQMTGHYIMISRKRASVNVGKHMIASYVLSLIDSNNNVSKRMWSYIKVRRLTIVGLLLCDIMTELTLTPKIKPLYLILKTVPCQLCMDGNSFSDISPSPLLIHDKGVTNLLSNLN